MNENNNKQLNLGTINQNGIDIKECKTKLRELTPT